MSNIYIGNKNVSDDWQEENNSEAVLNKLRMLIKNYLELDNVSMLFGTGSTYHIGSVLIRNIPDKLEEYIKSLNSIKESEGIYDDFINVVMQLQKIDSIDKIERKDNEIKVSYEDLLNYLLAYKFIEDNSSAKSNFKNINLLIKEFKKGLFKLCNLDKAQNRTDSLTEEDKKILSSNKYIYHEKLLKKLLQRPLNLKRANIFTTNYDLAFENAFDNLSINYIDGFSGFHKRNFRPEVFDYDIYYPGSTTTGKVHRIEKVIRYYKLHGSISWVSQEPSQDNIYGIREYPLDTIEANDCFENLVIYPSSQKKKFTLDFPYSELFRQFSSCITQQQSVLITCGYSFYDEHINDIIYQALSLPSFTLIVVDLMGTKLKPIEKLKELDDPRIIIIEGEEIATFINFVEKVLPDLYDVDHSIKIKETFEKLYSKKDQKDSEGENNE